MFVASYRNTMRNAKPFVEPIVPTAEEVRQRREDEKAERLRVKVAEWEAQQEKQRLQRLAIEEYRTIEVRPVAFSECKTTAKEIITTVAAAHGLAYADIVGVRRNRKYVRARHAAICAVADARRDMSLVHIGRIFKRDHTTILHALRKAGSVARMMEEQR